MQLAMVGLGRMGANMVRRLMRGGHDCVAFDLSPESVKELEKEGATGASSLEDLAKKLARPRVAWVMVPAGNPTEATVRALGEVFEKGDIIIDGGNSYFKDDVRRAKVLAQKGVHYVDVGTSGGVWGLERGYCMMIGGDDKAVGHIDPILKTLAPGQGDIPRTPRWAAGKMEGSAEEGYLHCGPVGSGHFVKMVHNGIEYGLMQAYAEGFEILHAKQEYELDVHQIAEIWRFGSVVRSWLLDLIADALDQDVELSTVRGWVADSGEGRWTVAEAIDLDVPAPIITLALQMRFVSRQDESYAAKLLAAMRHQFGGHAFQPVEPEPEARPSPGGVKRQE
jgi:6-phosphogluconate dehydrogenase